MLPLHESNATRLLAQKFFLAGTQSQQDTPTAETTGKTTSRVSAGLYVKTRHLWLTTPPRFVFQRRQQKLEHGI